MSDSERVSVQRRVPAAASEIFALITDPHGHVRIDGSGMLVAPVDAKRLERVGDSFEMDMDREPLGDVPLGRYKVINTVTRFSRDAHLEWGVAGVGMPNVGHVYGYLLDPVDATTTDVTSYCDWSGSPERWKARITWPVVPVASLEKSLENLARVVAASAG
ncbi:MULTISPECIES: polyketide cyclase [Frankia]|nr:MULTISPECIES: polyketide cyclase [Frankia]